VNFLAARLDGKVRLRQADFRLGGIAVPYTNDHKSGKIPALPYA
jgi:hypothetical protein